MKEEHHDLSTSEISSLVYNTRGVKPYHIKPLRVNQGQASSMIPSIENPPADKSKTTDQLNTEVPIDSAHSNERLFLKLNSLLLRRVERPEHAQSIVSVLKKLRKNFPVEKIIEKHFEHHFLFPLISSCDFFMKFDYLVEEALAFILPLVRQEGKRQNLMDDILSSGAFLFSFASIRQYISNPNIRSLSLELLVCSIDFILELVMVNSPYKDKKYANQSFVVHELVLHGGTTFLPSLLASFLHSQSEIGIRRVLKCEYIH